MSKYTYIYHLRITLNNMFIFYTYKWFLYLWVITITYANNVLLLVPYPFFKKILYRSVTALQCGISIHCTTRCVSRGCMCVLTRGPPFHPHPTLSITAGRWIELPTLCTPVLRVVVCTRPSSPPGPFHPPLTPLCPCVRSLHLPENEFRSNN